MAVADLAMQRAFAEACFGDDEGAADAGGLPSVLSRAGVSGDDMAALVAERPRIWLYRRLVRGNVTDVIGRMMPRARVRMNEAADHAFERGMAAFLRERAPRTHHLRDVPMEFLAFAAPRWRADPRVPAYTVDLATYELCEFSLGVSYSPPPTAPPGEVVVDRPLSFVEAKALVSLEHAVHRLPEGEDDRTVPEASPATLLGYRDPAHAIRFLELSPLASRILARLFDGEPLERALPAACADQGTRLTDEILASTAVLLADLADRGVFLGSSES